MNCLTLRIGNSRFNEGMLYRLISKEQWQDCDDFVKWAKAGNSDDQRNALTWICRNRRLTEDFVRVKAIVTGSTADPYKDVQWGQVGNMKEAVQMSQKANVQVQRMSDLEGAIMRHGSEQLLDELYNDDSEEENLLGSSKKKRKL